MRRDEPRLPAWVRFDPMPVETLEVLGKRVTPARQAPEPDPIDARLDELRDIVARLAHRNRRAFWRWYAATLAVAVLGLGLGLPLAWGLDELRAGVWAPMHSE